ncbi:hypothetical protein GGF32_006499 [Allomyces javanicus]|nr:hypothetical protein GGF32_006499 [Allomyces javanicus]
MARLNYDIVEHILLKAIADPNLRQFDAKNIFRVSLGFRMNRVRNRAIPRINACSPGQAAAKGQIDLLEWWAASRHHLSHEAVASLGARYRQIHVLEWLLARGHDFTQNMESVVTAAHYGHIDVLEWHLERGFTAFFDTALRRAVVRNNVHVLEWFQDRSGVDLSWDDLDITAAIADAVLSLQWLHARYGINVLGVISVGMWSGANEVMAWIDSFNVTAFWSTVLDELDMHIIDGDSVGLVKGWINTGRPCVLAQDIAMTSARLDDENVIAELYAHPKIIINWDRVIEQAVDFGSTTVLTELFDQDSGRDYLYKALKYAGVTNNVVVVDWVFMSEFRVDWTWFAKTMALNVQVEILDYLWDMDADVAWNDIAKTYPMMSAAKLAMWLHGKGLM